MRVFFVRELSVPIGFLQGHSVQMVRWQGTSCSSSFVSKVLGANYNRANNFHPVADKFATCTGQEVTFEPTNNAHVLVDYNTLTCCFT